MQIIVHRGIDQIGGCITEVRTARTKIFIDLGRNLPQGNQPVDDKLDDAEAELAEAREDLDAMETWDLYLLDRNSNLGYTNLDSSSDIVAGVSRILPVFFLLVASLVCITTMTRMIDEERTQIGTLKALGYSNAAIISKYLLYSGTGALLGCSLVLWRAVLCSRRSYGKPTAFCFTSSRTWC